ncbi:MAG: energy transducer TonB [Ignavibacteriaceae bacterium]|nr:energy transducer TonB [Ignavibacteriaceae bacterium]MCW8816387.1 energy transducer TonB [Ignavibacteriaceae bacterium]MCW8822463.1 energy transducer TonB [Ignavibacteriaceae bacterium]
MISRFKEHKHYSRNIKISFILSELLIICAFLFSPKITHNKSIKFSEPLFIIDDIPITIQSDKNISEKPMTPEIFMDEEIDEPVILDNIIFANIEEKEISGSNEVMEVNKLNWAGKPGPPRQLLEVLPDKRNRNYSGSLKLKLKIDRSGKVADYVILFNSIDCEDCLKEIISAVYKSLWEPGIKNGLETEFWVEKSYTFN